MDSVEWVRFGDLFSEPLRNGLNRPKSVRGSGVKMVNMGELFSYPRISDEDMERVLVSENEAQKYLLQEGDLLFARQSLVYSGAGQCSIFVGSEEPVTYEGHLIRARLDKRIANPYFYFYLFSSSLGKSVIGTIVEQVAAAGIRGSDLTGLQVPYVPVDLQNQIANILGTLDDKIELNHRMNATLEAIARAIFKSWFVDFDPVHAKVNGEQPYGMDAELAALFPDAFEESELGLIPAGWEVVPIGKHVSATKGLSYKGKYLVDGADDGIPMHNLNSVEEFGGYKYEGIKWYAGDYKPRHLVHPGDVIVANTEQGFDLLLIASPAIVPSVFGDMGIVSHHIYKVEPRSNSPLTRRYIYHLFNSRRFRATLQGYTNGTTVNMLPPDAFEKPLFVLPPQELIEEFDSLVAPMIQRQESNYTESQLLAELRDMLLPRLISGEIRVGEVMI